jgi:uncharacterized damage-inducible protein DinB
VYCASRVCGILEAVSLETQIAYHRWAITRTLESCRALSVEEFTRELGGSFPSIRKTLAHSFMADNTWAHRVRGEAFARPPMESLPADLETLHGAWKEVLEGWEALVNTRAAGETIRYHAFDGSPFQSRFEDIVLHMVNHGSYHRGQAVNMMRLLGHQAQGTDFIAFTRG